MTFRRLIAPFFALAGLVLVPWTVWLTFSLPAHHESDNWQTVWAGFDIALALALLATAICALRRSPWLPVAAAIAGALLCVDAWFDITLEAGGPHLLSAVLEAIFVELPLAGICFWVARDAEHAVEHALHRARPRLATSRADRPARGRASPRPHTRDRPRPGDRSRDA